ncbi:hypothetical protein [Methanoregula sp.]|jgi:hypothetical protein|uniref:hypothetical protein n=1 Tax=Methanoregula sp. TaxID=2052170 RepID=UPI00356776E5
MTLKTWLIRARNRLLRWFGTADCIDGLNTGEEWSKASFNTILFHWIMKEPLRHMVRLMPDIPQSWIDNLTGTQKLLYEIAKKKWYNCDKSEERREKLWKPFLFALIFWQQDEAAEIFDPVFYEILRRRDEFFIPAARLDPANWYMDRNPKLPDNGPGRMLSIALEDPPVRFDALTRDDVIVLLERPARGFVCLRDAAGQPIYTVINRFQCTKLPAGGYQYQIAGKTAALYQATNMANAIENGGA